VTGTPSAEASPARTTSSAEYLVRGIKRHKWVAFIALALLVIASAASYFFFPQSHQSIESLAVLPFANVGADPNTEYLADGIPESISNSLSQLPHLKVMSRTSVFSFKGREVNAQEVGQKLGVRAVLTGRVAPRGESLAINLQLVDARDNRLIWGQQYNRRLADVFAVQERICSVPLAIARRRLQKIAIMRSLTRV
jgi:TolB-like protein